MGRKSSRAIPIGRIYIKLQQNPGLIVIYGGNVYEDHLSCTGNHKRCGRRKSDLPRS